MKNKILTSALLLSAAAVVSSCQFEDEDFFDESASLRIEHFNDKVAATLVKPQNGWVMQYFTGTKNYHFEGFNLFAKFKDSQSVLLAGDHRMLRYGNANKYTEDESLYSLLQEEGPVLAFNTWNDVLSVFCDPVSPGAAPGALINDGEGMNGDYSFIIESCDDDEILLVGERYRAHVRLVPCNSSWQDYIASVADMKSKITNASITSYYLTNGVDTMYISGLRGGRMRYSERVNDPLKVDSLSCVFTPQGFRLENERKIGEEENETPFQEFVLSDDKTKLVSGDVQCIARWDYYIVNRTSLWKFDSSTFNAQQTAMYQAIDEALKTYNANYTLESLGIGKTSGGKAVNGLVVTFYTNAAKTKSNTCGVAINMSRAGFGQITYSHDNSCAADQNLTNMVKKAANLESCVRNFATSLNGTYDMVPDDYFLPTGATFNLVGGGSSFTLK